MSEVFLPRAFNQEVYDRACNTYNRAWFEAGADKAYMVIIEMYHQAKEQGIEVVLPWNQKATE